MNTHVNFETAKLLKEKGFEGIKSPLWYYKDGTIHESHVEYFRGLKCWNTWEATQGVRWDAPTISEVVMWLYENHGIWIYTWNSDINMTFRVWIQNLRIKSNDTIEVPNVKICNSPTEAYEAAIFYTLNNLI